MNKDRLIELLTKRQSGAITLLESHELTEYFKSHAEEQQLADLLQEVLRGHFHQQQHYQQEYIETKIKKLHGRLNIEKQPEAVITNNNSIKSIKLLRSVAAILIITLSCFALYFYLNAGDAKSPKNVLATKKGSRSSLVLPDGTKVLLNADTKLSYDQSFGKKIREVSLEGEAYFEVVKDSKHPFIVHTKTMDIKVLGTTFNVRAYNGEKNTQTTLIKGSVEVTLNNRKDKVVLKPSEKIIVKNDADSSLITTSQDNPIANISVVNIKKNLLDSSITETEWTKNRLVFDQAYYSEVFPELERWYGIIVTVKDSTLLKRKISGSYENEELKEVLESFKLATGFHYKIENNNLVVY